MKKNALQIVILLLLIGCKTRTENNVQRKTVDTPQIINNKKEIPQLIHLMVKPDSVTIDAAKTAVIVVDMENDFGAKGGMFDRAGINISEIKKSIGPTAKVLAAARQGGMKIIYLKMGYHPNLSDLGDVGSLNSVQNFRFMHLGETITTPNGLKSRILIRDNWGTDIVPELKPHAGDIILYKTRFSGFYQTNLDSTLKQLGKKYLVVIGCTTSVCVESTVRDAMFRDYLPIVLQDCTAEPIGAGLPRTNKEASLLVIQEAQFGWVSDSKEFIREIQGQTGKDIKLE